MNRRSPDNPHQRDQDGRAPRGGLRALFWSEAPWKWLAQCLHGDYLRRWQEDKRRRAIDVRDVDLVQWGRTYLPQHFRLPPSAMHLWLAARLDALPGGRGGKINCIGPRGSAKSTLVTLAYVLQSAITRREPYIWIVSDTKHQASAHLQNVRAELEENDQLARDYPGAVGSGPLWRNTALVLPNGVTIESFGTGQRIRGHRRRQHRPTLIVCDDLQNDSHIASAVQRDHSRRWFHGTLMKAGTRRTNIVNLATALHTDALAVQLSRTPGWTSRTFRAIVRWPQDMARWQQWEALYTDPENAQRLEDARRFYEAHRIAMDQGSVVLWPEEEDLYTLMCMRVESGHASFEREKQGSPLDPDACEFPEGYFGPHIWFDTWPRRLEVKTIAIDPSKGRDAKRGDWTAFVMLGVDPQGDIYIEAELVRCPTPEIVDRAAELCAAFRPHALGVETNQFQELLADALEVELRTRHLAGISTWGIDNRTPKAVRIRRLGPLLAKHRLRFKADSPGTTMLVDQLRTFPVGDHDDGPDAAEMALRLAMELWHGRQSTGGLPDRLFLE